MVKRLLRRITRSKEEYRVQYLLFIEAYARLKEYRQKDAYGISQLISVTTQGEKDRVVKL